MWSQYRAKTRRIVRRGLKMAGSNVVGSQKEMTAVINNLKETRVLDKAAQTLSLEESYAMKLLDLENKVTKFKYGRMKTTVGKIKSYLTAEEITAMKALELEGKLKPAQPVIVSSNLSKIAAAERRLKLNSYIRKRAASATPRMLRSRTDECSITSCGQTTAADSEDHGRRCASRADSNITRKTTRQVSLSSTPSATAIAPCKPARPHTSPPAAEGLIKKRLLTSSGKRQRPNTAEILERITTAQKANKNQNKKTTYSCHDIKADDDLCSSLGDIFGPSPYEMRRRSFLEAETKTFEMLISRQRSFVVDTQDFVKRNPTVSMREQRPEATEELIQAIDSMARRPGSVGGKSARSFIDKIDPALLKQFTELKKTRYLRIDDDLVDHSGVSTLAKAQFEKTQSWRNYTSSKSVTFKTSAAP